MGNFWDTVKSTLSIKKEVTEVTIKGDIRNPNAYFPTGTGYANGPGRLLGVYNGEKNLGEAGPIKFYMIDYAALSMRSYQAFLESPQAMAILNKFFSWVIGSGLKLQCEPIKEITSAVNKDIQGFTKEVEALWLVYSNSKVADYSGLKTLQQKAYDAYKNSILGGDVLVVLRYDGTCVKTQIIDGFHIQSPYLGSEWFPFVTKNGNRIINGIEINDQGEHIAFYVRKPFDQISPINPYEVERIPAKQSKGSLTTAFMVYGEQYRLDSQRGIPLLTTVLEKLKVMERYDTATLASAEEQAKIAYQAVHELGSIGEFPMTQRIATAFNGGVDTARTDDGVDLAAQVLATTDKQVVNNPPGTEIKTLKDGTQQLYYADFLSKNTDVICACVEIPPNVAAGKYDSNYSASRAAIKDWEHTLQVKRKNFATQFYQPIFNFFLEIEVLKNNIQAPGYLIARYGKDFYVLESYRTTRWVGSPVANIDPLKEVQAERMKLGDTAVSIPLTTVEAATEILNGGDSIHNMEQYSDELQMSKDLKIELPPEVTRQDNIVN